MMKLPTRALILLFILVVVGLPLSHTLTHVLTEVWWFEAVGYDQVFWTQLTWQVLLWVITFTVYTLFLGGNYQIAMGNSRDRPFQFLTDTGYERYANLFSRFLVVSLTLLIAWGAALNSTTHWQTVLKFLNPSEFGDRDPIFDLDIGFYTFQLPFYELLRSWLLFLLMWGLAMALLVYTLKGIINLNRGWHAILTGAPKTHLSVLLAAIAVITAWGFWLDRYQLLYSPEGVVFGAGYTDIHARLVAFAVMALLSLVLAVIFLLAMGQPTLVPPASGLVLYIVVLVGINGLYPWLQQTLIVEPNELDKEKPFIQHNIELTQKAYRLDQVKREDYAAQGQLTAQILQQNQSTLNNIRLWDYRPLLSTYRQLQEIRLYYTFQDVDVDRYTLDDTYQQVMLSARELSVSQLPAAAQTWVNQRLKYTHGYGLVMSPVSRATEDGLPDLYIKNIPPESKVDLTVDQAAIYYGEVTNNYIFTGTTTQEFDYPQGNQNALTNYSGKGGVPLSSLGRRLAYAYDFNSLQLLISNYLTTQSRIHYHRQIRERVSRVAPFLQFDEDPYLVVVDGRLQWVIDAYTVSNRYPYAEPIVRSQDVGSVLGGANTRQFLRGNINYIRNAVKVVVDAYDGTLQFYITDATDPLLQTYAQIFPNLLQPEDTIPANLKAHFRFPLDLFKIQAQMYRAYHMNDPEVFYNREDLWQFPVQTFEGNQQLMNPYYVTMRLPGETQTEFILILPFTPTNKDNMIAWMAARSTGAEYGKLLLYEFPKQKLVYGPSQIEARIDQEPTISQQFTLWSQAGSKVIRGDLLVIPIEESLLYVEPVYLRAEQGELPELKRAIVSYQNAVVMAETLEQALAKIFGQQPTAVETTSTRPAAPVTPASPPSTSLPQSALETYQKAEDALKQGNWAEYGRQQAELEKILRQLNR